MSFIFPLIYMIFFTYSLSIFIKKKFERLLPFTLIISGISLFLSQFIFKTFYVGFAVCILFSLIFPIKLLLKKEKFKDIKEKYITKGLLAFIVLYLIVYIMDFNRFFTRWDELSHWGKMVKEMIKLDNFYSISTSNLLVHKDYPPIMSLIELFYSLISGGYKEVYLIRCMHLFEGTLIISCLSYEKASNKQMLFKTIILLIFMYFLTFILDTAIVINCIYTDYILALFVSYTLYNIFKNKDFDYYELVLLSISCIFLLLLKQVSIAFYLMILFLLSLVSIINKNKFNLKKLIITIMLLILLPILFLSVWNRYIDNLGIKGQFEVGDIKIDTVIPMIKGESGEPWQRETIHNYIDALFNKSILNSNLNITYVQFIIIVIFILVLLVFSKKEVEEKKKISAVLISLLIGFAGYAVLMLLLYVYSFGEVEGPMLASYDRYMSTYVLICLYTIIFIYVRYNDIKVEYKSKYITMIFILLILVKPSSYLRLRPDLIIFDNHFYDNYKSASEKIDKNVNNKHKVYIIDQNERDGAVFYINYFSNKISTNLLNYVLPVNLNNLEDVFYSNYYDYMKDYDYLYTYDIDDDFIKKYQFLSSNKLKENTLYKINNIGNRLLLEEVD